MSKVVVEQFGCPGSDGDCPTEGFHIIESDVPGFNEGDMLLDIEPLKKAGLNVEVVDEEPATEYWSD